jgi:hypothetical protein
MRPTQQAFCNTQYDALLKVSLPFRLVNCSLHESQDYYYLRKRVAQVVDMLSSGNSTGLHPQSGAIIADNIDKMEVKAGSATTAKATDTIDKIKTGQVKKGYTAVDVDKKKNLLACGRWIEVQGVDPLIVSAEKCIVDGVKGDSDQNFGFAAPSAKSGFNFTKQGINHIDGASTPVLLEVNPPDPQKIKTGLDKSIRDKTRTTITPEDKLKNVLESGGKKPEIDSISQGSLENLKKSSQLQDINKADIKNLGAADVSLQGQKISGTATGPGSIAPVTEKLNSALQNVTKEKDTSPSTPMSLQYPDVTAADSVTIVGKIQKQMANWNSLAMVDTKDAVSTANGLCAFSVQYMLRNLASGKAGSFKSAWTNNATMQTVERTWGSIAPNSVSPPTTDSIWLKPGQNLLTLDIDKAGSVKETNEANNQFRVTINVTGNCSATAVTAPVGGKAAPAFPAIPQPQRGTVQPLRR